MDERNEAERGDDGLELHRRRADSCLQHRKDWSRCSEDGLRHLATHLYQLRHLPRYRQALCELIDESWMQARCAGDAWSGAGFLGDLELAWQAAASDTVPDAVLLARLRTAREGVLSQAGRYSDELLQALVWLDQADQAIDLARLRTSAPGQIKGLLAVHDALVARGAPGPAVLAEARALTARLGQGTPDHFDENARLLQRLAGALAAVGDIGAAHETATSIKVKRLRCATLARLASTAAASSEARSRALFDEAWAIIGALRDASEADSALADLAAALAEAGRVDEAQAATDAIEAAWKRAEALVGVAAALPPADLFADRLSREARSLAASVRDAPESAFCLGEIAAAFGRAGRLAEACELSDWVPETHRDEALRELTGALARAQLFAEASQVADRIQGAWKARSARQNLASALLSAGRFSEADRLISAMDDPHESLCDVAGALAAAGKHQQAYEVSRRIQPGPWRVRVLARLAAALAPADPARAGELVEAALAEAAPPRELPPSEALIGLVAALAHAREPGGARRVAERIPDRLDRMEAMGALAAVLVGQCDPQAEQLLAELMAAVDGGENGPQGARAQGRIARGLTREGAFAQARRVAEAVANESERWLALVRIAEGEHRQGILDGTADIDVDSLADGFYQWRAGQDHATTALAEAGEVDRFFAELNARSDGSQAGLLDGYLEELFRWAPVLQRVTPGGALPILRESLRVAGWVRPDWRSLHETAEGPD